MFGKLHRLGRQATRTRSSMRSQSLPSSNARERSWSSVSPTARPSSSGSATVSSSSSSVRSSAQRSSNATDEPTSSSTSICGASRGLDRDAPSAIRCANECSVPMAAPSRSFRASSRHVPCRSVAVGALSLEPDPEPIPQLRAGLLGEGHRRDAAQRYAVDEHQVDHPVDQRCGLAGSGAGVDEERATGLAGDLRRAPTGHAASRSRASASRSASAAAASTSIRPSNRSERRVVLLALPALAQIAVPDAVGVAVGALHPGEVRRCRSA